jgi:hypothetical protein
MKLTPGEIRALGGDWPLDPAVADLIALRGRAIDLDQTLDNLERAARHVHHALEATSQRARQWNAPPEVTDERDRYGSRRIACTEAIAQVRAIRERARQRGAWWHRMRARLASLLR